MAVEEFLLGQQKCKVFVLLQATAQPEGAPPLPQPNPAVFHQVMQQTAARQPSEPAAAPGVTQQQALPKENKAASATAHPPTTTGPPPFATPPEKQVGHADRRLRK